MNPAIQVINFQQDRGEKESRRLRDLPDRVVQGDPNHDSTTFFKSASGDVIAGSWTSTPGTWRAFTDRDEFCTIVSGLVRLVTEDGQVQTFQTGDAFLIPNGFRGYWDVVETTTKHFVIRLYEPA